MEETRPPEHPETRGILFRPAGIENGVDSDQMEGQWQYLDIPPTAPEFKLCRKAQVGP